MVRQPLSSTDVPRPPVVLISVEQEWAARSLESVLGPNGFGVVRAHSGRQALELAQAVSPDAILLDSRLPDMDGVQVCRTLRENGSVGAQVPIVLLKSGRAPRDVLLDAYRAGAWGVWEQPLDGELLALRLRTWVGAKHVVDAVDSASLVDAETGLYSLVGLSRRSRELSAAALRRVTPVSCVSVAPLWGASQGVDEQALRTVAMHIGRTLQSVARASDTVGRTGFAEFTVLAPDTESAGAVELVARLRDALATGSASGDTDVTAGLLGISAGVSTLRPTGVGSESAPDLLRQAAAALRYAHAARQPSLRLFDEVPPSFT